MNNFLFNISAAAIITTVFKLLSPEERYGRQIKLLISCFFIVTIISFFRNSTEFIDFSNIIDTKAPYNDYTVTFEKHTANETANNLRQKIKEHLLEENIIPEKIYIDINITDNSSISINEIRLVFDNIYSEAAERAVKITRECVENKIKVTLEEG